MILFIDTSCQETLIKLIYGQKTIRSKTWQSMQNHSEELLPEISILLGEDKSNIKKIIVNSGPGSYTGLRVGITVANLLAFAFDIPVDKKGVSSREKSFQLPVLPEYGRDPFITKSRSGL
ncbi:MAG: tRNA (adenosine(37)-N6)-threonylcarbamoyltransferase complex dimerization subunit type 1 TsaB [Patescibacteria group bacterium]